MELSNFLTPATGATGILALVVMLVLWGKIVPRATLDDLRTDKDQQIQAWRDAYNKSEEARDLMRGQVDELLQLARTTTHVIESLPGAPGNSGRRRRADVPSEDAP